MLSFTCHSYGCPASLLYSSQRKPAVFLGRLYVLGECTHYDVLGMYAVYFFVAGPAITLQGPCIAASFLWFLAGYLLFSRKEQESEGKEERPVLADDEVVEEEQQILL
jgi:hypothetical protein